MGRKLQGNGANLVTPLVAGAAAHAAEADDSLFRFKVHATPLVDGAAAAAEEIADDSLLAARTSASAASSPVSQPLFMAAAAKSSDGEVGAAPSVPLCEPIRATLLFFDGR